MPLFNFFKAIETEDLRYLIKLKDYEFLPKEVDNSKLINIWQNIQTEYGKHEDSNGSIIQFTTAKHIHKLELEYLMLWNIYNLIAVAPEEKKTKELIKEAGLEKETFKTIEKKLKTLGNKIKLKRQDVDQQKSNKKVDFWRIIDEIEDIKGRSLDVYKTTVRQYIAIRKNIKLKNGKRQNNTKRRN